MKVAVIEVKRTGEGDPLEFAVIVRVWETARLAIM
jgi:hypothetical protein